MAVGVIIAKEGFNINGEPDELYVEPTTSLHKVIKNAVGAFSTDGTTWTSKGELSWVQLANNGTRKVFELAIPFPELDYVPQYLAYMDTINNGKRMLLSSDLSGVALEGSIAASAVAGMDAATQKIPEVRLRIEFLSSNVLLAGEYGYFVQVYYDRLQRKP